MQPLILLLDFATAITAFLAGYLWFRASRVKPGINNIDATDGYHDEFIELKHSLKMQSRYNSRGALWSCIAACCQGLAFLATLFHHST